MTRLSLFSRRHGSDLALPFRGFIGNDRGRADRDVLRVHLWNDLIDRLLHYLLGLLVGLSITEARLPCGNIFCARAGLNFGAIAPKFDVGALSLAVA